MNRNYKTTIYLATTCKNASETIERTFESIADQENKLVNGAYSFHLRYHVQDSCSTDGTLDLIKKWQEKFQVLPWCTFSYTSEQDKTMYEGINKAFDCMGAMDEDSYMSWINADDIFFPQCLSTVSDIKHQLPQLSWIGGRKSNIDMQDNILSDWLPHYPQNFIKLGLCNGNLWYYVQQEGTFWKRKLWDIVGGLDTHYKYIGDWELWQRMANKAEYTIINKKMGAFRHRDGQLSTLGYHEELNMHTNFSILRNRLKELLYTTKLLSKSSKTYFVKYTNGQYKLKENQKLTSFNALRLLLISYDAKKLLSVYNFLGRMKGHLKSFSSSKASV